MKLLRWLLLLLLPVVVYADIVDLNVTVDECSSALLILGPFVTEDGRTPVLPDTLSIQINARGVPPADQPLLANTTVTPPSCTACTTTTGVTVTCDPATAICQFVLPGTANKVVKRHGPQQQTNICTIQWTWPLGRSVDVASWQVLRSIFLEPPC